MNSSAAIRLLRPEQWIKNTFVLLPAFFAARFLELEVVYSSLLALLAFCCVSSLVYILNDWVDQERDRLHPTKKNRPIASGQISSREAVGLGIGLLGLGLGLGWYLGQEVFFILLAYIGINIAYSFKLKHIAIVDVSIISLGFLLRIFAGGAVAAIPISHWLIVMTFLLAMILGLGKRRSEYVLQNGQTPTRKSLDGYSLPFIDLAMTLMTAVTIVAYLMYTLSDDVMSRIGSTDLYFTTIFVILGILRYLQLAIVFQQTASPTRVLLTDRFLQLLLLGWIGMFAWLLYAA